MSDIVHGTGALKVVEVGALRRRPTFNLPALAVAPDYQPNHVLVVTGETPRGGATAC